MSASRGAPHLSRRISECLPDNVRTDLVRAGCSGQPTAKQVHTDSSSEDEFNRKIEVSSEFANCLPSLSLAWILTSGPLGRLRLRYRATPQILFRTGRAAGG